MRSVSRIVAPLTWRLVALALVAMAPVLAASEIELTPYQARYSTTAMGLGMTLERSLRRDGDRFTLRNEGSVLIASLKEVAHFSLVDGQIRGDTFSYKLGGLVRRKRAVEFLPEQNLIRSLRKDRWTEHTWQANILDRLSQQEQLRLDLMTASTAPSTLRFHVIDGPRVRERVLELVGKETLETALGALETVHYRQLHDDPDERSSDIWLAPSLDFTMVRTVHIEDGTEVQIELQSIEFDSASTAEQRTEA